MTLANLPPVKPKPLRADTMTTFTDYETYDALGLADLIRRREVSAAEVL